MHGAIPLTIVVEAVAIMAWRCLVFLSPIFAVAALWWLVNRMDQVINYFFPALEWEKDLGWLNIRAERQANAIWRWLGYAVYALLATALYGIVWSVQGLPPLDEWTDPSQVSEVATRLPVLLVSAGFWLVYLGCGLIPQLRNQYETEDLENFRAEQKELEREQELLRSRRKKSPAKPRFEMPARSNRMGPFG